MTYTVVWSWTFYDIYVRLLSFFGIFIKTVQLIILFTRVLSLGVNEIVYTWKIIQNMLMHPIKSYNGKNSVQFPFYKWVFHGGVYVTTHVW